jgi:hypothetical protein
MDSAFYVFPLHGGSHLFASDILSECVAFVAHRAQVSIVDMFGQVWLTV